MSRVQSSIEQRAWSREEKPITSETPNLTEDKAPCPGNWEMGLCICPMWGLRVSRLLDLREGYGPKTWKA